MIYLCWFYPIKCSLLNVSSTMSLLTCLTASIEGNIIMQAASPHAKRLSLGISFLVLLFLIPTLVACGAASGTSSTPGPKSTATNGGTGSATPTVTPEALLGVQPCPGATKDPAYW